MKFGKLSSIEGLPFNLGPNPASNQNFVQSTSSSAGKKQLFIGCTGWSMKEWVGKVYPRGTKTKEYLAAYTKQFNTIELNTTHYRIPDLDTIEKWKKNAVSDFKFCPKIPQTISHSRDLGMGSQHLRLFWDAISGLEEKLGCCFIQLPPHFRYSKIQLLEQFLELWPAFLPLAVEVRHESWFANYRHSEEWLALLNKYNKVAVITDVAGRRDVLHMGLSNSSTMIRFVGNDLHPTDYQRIDDWVERLDKWFDWGLENAYFFTHEPDNLLAPELASYLYGQSQKIDQIQTRGPQFENPEGDQLSLF